MNPYMRHLDKAQAEIKMFYDEARLYILVTAFIRGDALDLLPYKISKKKNIERKKVRKKESEKSKDDISSDLKV